MKRKGLWAAGVVLVASVGVLPAGAGYAEGADSATGAKCSLATLRGMYLFAYDGVRVSGGNQVPLAGAGYEVYDGRGRVSAVFSGGENGEILRNVHLSGSYTVKADCTGTATYPDANQHYDQFIAPDGSMFTFVQTDPGYMASGPELRTTARRVGD
jgi:hypothetical protein